MVLLSLQIFEIFYFKETSWYYVALSQFVRIHFGPGNTIGFPAKYQALLLLRLLNDKYDFCAIAIFHIKYRLVIRRNAIIAKICYTIIIFQSLHTRLGLVSQEVQLRRLWTCNGHGNWVIERNNLILLFVEALEIMNVTTWNRECTILRIFIKRCPIFWLKTKSISPMLTKSFLRHPTFR